MFKQKPFPFSILALIILVTLHLFGSYFSWYWNLTYRDFFGFDIPFYDIIIHLLAGFWIALVMLWLASILGLMKSLIGYKTKSFFIAVISAIILGIGWELVENYYQVTTAEAVGYVFNTTLDIICDAFGGLLAFLYFVKKSKQIKHDTEVLHPFYNQTGIIKN